MFGTELALGYDIIDGGQEVGTALIELIYRQTSIGVHQFSILIRDVKLVLLIELWHECHWTTFVDPTTDPMIVLESPERAVFVRADGITVVEAISTILF